MQRALLQYDRPANRKLLERALAELGMDHVLPKFLAAATSRDDARGPSRSAPRELPRKKRAGRRQPRRRR